MAYLLQFRIDQFEDIWLDSAGLLFHRVAGAAREGKSKLGSQS